MSRHLASYAAALAVILLLDMLWLGVVARSAYQAGIGHLLAERPNIPVALLFYLVYALGLMVFAIVPTAQASGVRTALLTGAMFGFFAYATYDLTNLATLKGWPVVLSMMDMAWGSLISALAAGAGKLVMNRVGSG